MINRRPLQRLRDCAMAEKHRRRHSPVRTNFELNREGLPTA
jgi:hypothetical protein